MTPEEMKERAILIMTKGFRCSQSVLTVGLEKLEKEYNDESVRSMCAFAAGLAGTGNVCGGVAGALAVFGLVFGRSREDEKEDPLLWPYCQEFMRCFRKETVPGSIFCRDITGVDWKDQNQIKDYYNGEKRQECLRLIGEAARIVGELLDEYQQERKQA
jgi:C_GCAxxG_C_C family probable redox protein